MLPGHRPDQPHCQYRLAPEHPFRLECRQLILLPGLPWPPEELDCAHTTSTCLPRALATATCLQHLASLLCWGAMLARVQLCCLQCITER